jgi:hypothetical protein
VEFCPQYDDENLSEKFLAEMEFCKIDPWSTNVSSHHLIGGKQMGRISDEKVFIGVFN